MLIFPVASSGTINEVVAPVVAGYVIEVTVGFVPSPQIMRLPATVAPVVVTLIATEVAEESLGTPATPATATAVVVLAATAVVTERKRLGVTGTYNVAPATALREMIDFTVVVVVEGRVVVVVAV